MQNFLTIYFQAFCTKIFLGFYLDGDDILSFLQYKINFHR